MIHKQQSKNVYKTLLNTVKYHSDYYKLIKKDEEWYDIQPILKILRKQHPEKRIISAFDIKHMIIADVKKRMEISKDLKYIRLKTGGAV